MERCGAVWSSLWSGLWRRGGEGGAGEWGAREVGQTRHKLEVNRRGTRAKGGRGGCVHGMLERGGVLASMNGVFVTTWREGAGLEGGACASSRFY